MRQGGENEATDAVFCINDPTPPGSVLQAVLCGHNNEGRPRERVRFFPIGKKASS